MIPDTLIEEAKRIAAAESERWGMPIGEVIPISNEAGQRLAGSKRANAKIVLLGTLLMDCWLGEAAAAGKQPEHAQFCCEKTEDLLDRYPDLTKEEEENILACVREHHGVPEFHSIESEICCNADCYRFASARGMLVTIARMRPMKTEKLVELCVAKLEEKWKAVTIPDVKHDLAPDYIAIRAFLGRFK